MSEKAWINGEYFELGKKLFDASLGTIHYGLTAFEGILCVYDKRAAIFRVQDHIDRFYKSAEALDFNLPYSKEESLNIIKDVIRVNGPGTYYVRPIVFKNSDYLDLIARKKKLFVAVLCKRFNITVFLLLMRRKIEVMISKNTRNVWADYLTKAKLSGKYLVSAIAKLEANKHGFDDALLLDGSGMVSEATAANVFMVKDGLIKTPFINNTLSGITQDSVIIIARNLGYEVIESDISVAQLFSADEVFLTNTAEGIVSLSRIDDNIIKNKTNVAAQLRTNYIDIIRGKNPRYADWLTPVEIKSF
jgi:branched-chain amino acid aminotransferase